MQKHRKILKYFFGQKLTGASDKSEVSPKGEIVNKIEIHLSK